VAKKEKIKFYVHQLILIGKEVFDCSDFDLIKESDAETFEIAKGEEREILTVKKISKIIYEDRFIAFAFDEGAKYPYPPRVINNDLREQDNPRASDLIELDVQTFVLIDVFSQRIWISNQKKKNQIANWLKEKINTDVIIKSIIKDGEFIDKIRSVREVSFTVVPNIFNTSKQDILSSHLVQDLLGFGAQKAKLSLEFNNSRISDTIKSKLNDLIGRKNEFTDITVIGCSDENLESTFNLEEISSKVQLDLPIIAESGLLDSNNVFSSLINIIKEV